MKRLRAKPWFLLVSMPLIALTLWWARSRWSPRNGNDWLLLSTPVFGAHTNAQGVCRTVTFSASNVGPRTLDFQVRWFECRAGAGPVLATNHLMDPAARHSVVRVSWNDMVTATRAFLAHDRPSLLAARERLAAAGYPELKYIDRLCDTLGSSYADMYWWAPLCPAVAFPQDASSAHRAAAEKLAKAFSFPATAVATNPQPSCIWVELRDFAPKSAAMGYVIIHSSDGTHITASNQYWLDAAVERLIKSSRESNGHREAPFGLTTSFNLSR